MIVLYNAKQFWLINYHMFNCYHTINCVISTFDYLKPQHIIHVYVYYDFLKKFFI